MAYELPTHVDSTMLGTASQCLQKFHAEFGLGLRPISVSIDLHAGGCFAAAMERYNRELFSNGLAHDAALGRAYATFTQEWGAFEIRNPNSPKTPENMWAAFERYLDRFPPRTDPVQPYFSSDAPSFEFSFAIPLDFDGFPRHPVTGDPFVYTGRFDLFGRLTSWGDIPCIRDEKTAQRLESNWASKWNLRAQFLGYCWALQHLGIRCSTVVVRGVIIYKARDAEIVEAIKQYPQHLIDRWFEQLKHNLWRIVRAHEEGYWDYNLGETCTAYSHCHFMDRCTSKDPTQYDSDFTERRWNPLNRNPLGAPSTIPLLFSGQIPDKFRHLLEAAP